MPAHGWVSDMFPASGGLMARSFSKRIRTILICRCAMHVQTIYMYIYSVLQLMLFQEPLFQRSNALCINSLNAFFVCTSNYKLIVS